MSSGNNSADLEPGHEIVFTVTDYYDGPIKGIANYHGKPHYYDRIFDEVNDEYSDRFQLTPIDEKTFELAVEDWEIWRRWEIAFHTGKADISSHPALPADAARQAKIRPTLNQLLVTVPDKAVIQTGKFVALGSSNLPRGIQRPLQVKWTTIAD